MTVNIEPGGGRRNRKSKVLRQGATTISTDRSEGIDTSARTEKLKVQEASMEYTPLHTFTHPHSGPQTILSVKLGTGRKHQIRALLSHAGHPIVGDVKYESPSRFKDRSIALHALSLTCQHPTTCDTMTFTAHLPSSWGHSFELGPLAYLLADDVSREAGTVVIKGKKKIT